MKNINDLKVYLESNKKELAVLGIIVEETLAVTTVFMGEKTLLFFESNVAVCEDGDIFTSVFYTKEGFDALINKTNMPQTVKIHNEIKAIVRKKSIQEKPLKVTMELVDDLIIDQNGNEYRDLGDGLVANDIDFMDYNSTVEDYLINNGRKLSISQQGDGFRARAGRHSVYGESTEQALSNLEYDILYA